MKNKILSVCVSAFMIINTDNPLNSLAYGEKY